MVCVHRKDRLTDGWTDGETDRIQFSGIQFSATPLCGNKWKKFAKQNPPQKIIDGNMLWNRITCRFFSDKNFYFQQLHAGQAPSRPEHHIRKLKQPRVLPLWLIMLKKLSRLPRIILQNLSDTRRLHDCGCRCCMMRRILIVEYVDSR